MECIQYISNSSAAHLPIDWLIIFQWSGQSILYYICYCKYVECSVSEGKVLLECRYSKNWILLWWIECSWANSPAGNGLDGRKKFTCSTMAFRKRGLNKHGLVYIWEEIFMCCCLNQDIIIDHCSSQPVWGDQVMTWHQEITVSCILRNVWKCWLLLVKFTAVHRSKSLGSPWGRRRRQNIS